MMTSIMKKEGSITQISEKEGETQGSIRITPEIGHSNEPVELKTTPPGRIINPTGLDVLFGRGKPYQGHTGNIRFHKVVAAFKQRYSQARRHEKTEIAEEIVQLIRTTVSPNSGPGRFLKRIEEDECWVEVSDTVARDKVSHALRGKPRKEDRANDATLAAGNMMMGGSGSMLQDLLSLKRGNMAMNNIHTSSKTGNALPFGDDERDTPQIKRQKLATQEMDMLAAGGGQNFFRIPANLMAGGNLMIQQQQQQQQQQLLASALAEQRQLAVGMAGQAYGGMGFYGNPGQNFANMRGQIQMMPPNGGSGGVDPMFLQQFAAERQMRGDPRFWM